MVLPLLAVIFAVILLFWSAGRFVSAAASLAVHYNLPPLIVGMVVLGFATSAPELLTSVVAALDGNPALAIGNAYGSNIANIGLGVGLTAVFYPIAVRLATVKKDFLMLIFVTLLTGILLWQHELNRISALILLIIFLVYMTIKCLNAKKGQQAALEKEIANEVENYQLSVRGAVLWLIIGLVSLLVSAQCLIWGAEKIANYFAVSQIVIGLTVVAIGTSLPEFAATLVASRKGEDELAIGNIIGSNLFNTLAAVGITAAISPVKLMQAVLYRDVSFMLILTLGLFCFCWSRQGQGKINRLEGGLLFAAYVIYTIYLVTLMV